jgi:hypothetical protein
MARIVEAADKQGVLIDRRGHDPLHLAGLRELDRTLDGESGEAAGIGLGTPGMPLADDFRGSEGESGRPDDDEINAGPHRRIRERRPDDLDPDTTGIAERHGQPHAGHRYSLRLTYCSRRSASSTRRMLFSCCSCDRIRSRMSATVYSPPSLRSVT